VVDRPTVSSRSPLRSDERTLSCLGGSRAGHRPGLGGVDLSRDGCRDRSHMLQALSGRRNEGGCPPLLWSAAPLPPGRGAAQWVLAFPFRRPIAKAPGSPGPGAREGRRRRAGTRRVCGRAAASTAPPLLRPAGHPRRAPTRSRPPLSPRHGSSRTFWPATMFAGFDGSNGQAAPLALSVSGPVAGTGPPGCLGNNCAAPASLFLGASLKWPQGCCLLDNPGARDIVFSQAFGPTAAPTDRPDVSA
jgi:hypothetical protein